MYTLVLLVLTLNFVSHASSWQFFTSIKDYTLYTSETETKFIHSEYTFGECKRKDIVLYAHITIQSMQILGKLIIRGWLDIKRIPTCIILRAVSTQADMAQSTGHPFQICVPRITYCHSHRRYKYFYYEWLIPHDYTGGMNWDLYFLGSPNLEWQ